MLSIANFMVFLQILLIDIALAGDNAIVVGLAAAGLPQAKRHQAVLAGIVMATILRILFSFIAVAALRVPGLLAVGGCLLVWVSWKMYRDLVRRTPDAKKDASSTSLPPQTLMHAIVQITVADVSMSLDNVLAVAGAARDNKVALAAGLIISVVLMGAAAAFIARLIARYPWIAYLGLAVILYTAGHMLWRGGQDILTLMH